MTPPNIRALARGASKLCQADQLALAVGDPDALAAMFTQEQWRALRQDWGFIGRPDQQLPDGDWFTWMLRSGRGWGKTRVGAETMITWAKGGEPYPMYIVGSTAGDVRDVMVEGESGIIAKSPPGFVPDYQPSKRRLVWPNGVIAYTRTAETPDRLRGPQGSKAWLDELAAWRRGEDAWDQINMMIRLGDPRVLVTTTPRPTRLIKEICSAADTVLTVGHTNDNRGNLSKKFMRRVLAKYEGTRLGRQELAGEILDDNPGALWKLRLIDDHRAAEAPDMRRVMVGVDPQGSAADQAAETGIVVAGVAPCGCKGTVEDHAFVLEDVSGGYSPAEWGDASVSAYENHRADRIVGERNFGGDMVEANIRAHPRGRSVSYQDVSASRGKERRAEPIVALYEQGKVHHVGTFAKLEDQMTQWDPEDKTARSPDRMDALVWVLSRLMLGSAPASYRKKPRAGLTSRV